ncbi:unnamed protein product [Owenia fusiformis]|uniref:Uncharacterized protein n=1 Tax=Owenia fusiformis TaxID=6347 RepID=A0A8J1XQ77_OWEFU|nr:unnamed protein product [Owenia fusiformis]
MDRARILFGHLNSEHKEETGLELKTASHQISADDIVVVSAKRTPICKAKRGSFKDTFIDDLLAAAFDGVLKDVNIDPKMIGDICVGNVSQPGVGALMARMAQFYVGIPETVPLSTVNRQCSSGLQAFMNIAGAIRNGQCEIGLAGGAEHMTSTGTGMGAMSELNPKVGEFDLARACLTPMGITSENVAERYGVTRAVQDQMAMESHAKAAKAYKLGYYKDEIIPVTTSIKDKEGNEKTITVDKDDGIREGTTLEVLGKLRAVFKPDGSTTAGNSSQTSDGAAAVLVAKRSAAAKHKLPILGVLRGFAVVGVDPEVMGIGPAEAIPVALKNAGVTLNDIDIFEINEAFASQASYCRDKLGIPNEKLNPKGGAIAIGHPLGCSGARMIATLLHELKRRGKRGYGVVSMCIGTGMGAAAVFEYTG